MSDSTAMKDRRIIIPFLLQKQILEQLHTNHMGIEKEGVGVLDEYEYRNQKCYKEMCHMPGISVDTPTREDTAI